MTKILLLVAFVLSIPQESLWAEEVFPKVEVFAGAALSHFKSPADHKTTPLGWESSVSVTLDGVTGIVGDFSAAYRDGRRTYSYLAGVEIREEKESARSAFLDGSHFVRFLLGGTTHSGGGTSNTLFTMGLGLGFDKHVNNRIDVRVFQVDWLPSYEPDRSSWVKSYVRVGFGVVFKKGDYFGDSHQRPTS